MNPVRFIASWLTRNFRGGMYIVGRANQPAPNAIGNVHEQIEEFRGWVYKCVNRRAQDIAGTRFRFKRQISEDEYAEISKHPVVTMMHKPNPYMTFYEMLWTAQIHADVTGNAYLVKFRNGLRLASELWPLDPRYVKIISGGADSPIQRYEYQVGTNKYLLEPNDVIHFKYPNPRNPWYGLSPLQANAIEIDIDNLVKEHQHAFLQNSPTPKWAFTSAGLFDDNQKTALRESLKRNHAGENAGVPLLLSNGTDVKELNNVPTEIGYESTRKLSRNDILTIFGIPPSIIGITEDVNRASAEAATLQYAKYTLLPILEMWSQKLTYDLAAEFGDNFVIIYDNPVPDDREARRADTQMHLQQGVVTINEVRRGEGYPDIQGGDVPMVDTNRIPITEIAVLPTKSFTLPESRSYDTEEKRAAYWRSFESVRIKHENHFAARMKAYFARQAQDVIQRLPQKDYTPLDVNAITFDLDIWNQIIEELALSEFTQISPDMWALAMKEIGSELPYTLSPETLRSVLTDALEHIKLVNATTLEDIRAAVTAGVENAASISEIEGSILNVFESASAGRARTIARTSVTQASNATLENAWANEPSIVKGHIWISSRDKKVRDAHGPHGGADGQKQPIGTPFNVGGEKLRYPGDPKGSAANVVNCRCTIAPALK